MKTLSVVSALGLFAASVAACGGSASSGTASADGGTSLPGSDNGGMQNAVADVSIACGAWFDAAGAFRTRCGTTPLPFDTFAAVKPAALATCGARAKNPGSGYTIAYYDGCRVVLETAGCEDYPAIFEACWTPTGALSKGVACGADDQCLDGLACETPLGSKAGSTCGTCQVPVFGNPYSVCGDGDDSTKDLVRCPAGTQCDIAESGKSRCFSTVPMSPDAGATIPVGSKCSEAPGTCADGSRCVSPDGGVSDGVCVSLGVLGDKCDFYQPCSNWLRCGGANVCELPDTLNLKCD